MKDTPPEKKVEARPGGLRFAPRCFALEQEGEPQDFLARLESVVRHPCLLDSAGGEPRRFSLLAFDPLALALPKSLAELRKVLRGIVRERGDSVPGFFQGGFLGALAYEALAREAPGLALPPDPLGLPWMVGGFYTDFLVRDEERGSWTLVLGDEPGDGRRALADRKRHILAALDAPAGEEPELHFEGQLERHVSEALHRERIERARSWIAEGEIYQANVTQRFSRGVRGSKSELYRRLRLLQPTPYAGYLAFDGGALLSASPELLLEFEAGRARTRPIKGTAPRDPDPTRDTELAQGLLESDKDLAELGMIVDLERNDLGRIAETDSVHVTGFPSLESYASVHHMAADVSCRPRDDVDALDALRSLFPGGSITGAPKRRCIELLAQLEEEGRGFFYGSLFSLDTRGRMFANLLIRTLIWRDGARPRVHYRTGGGITWASDSQLEERECTWKGEALARALGHESTDKSPLLLPR